MIEFCNLTHSKNKKNVIDGISLTVGNKTVTGIVGRPEATSALARLASGVYAPTSGNVLVDGKDIFNNEKAKSTTCFVPENLPYYADMTPFEYLSFLADIKGISYIDSQKSIKRALEVSRILTLKNSLIGNFSNAGKLRVGISQAYIGECNTLIIEMPSFKLDKAESQGINDLIRDVSKTKSVLVLASKPDALVKLCDNIYVINDDGTLSDKTYGVMHGTCESEISRIYRDLDKSSSDDDAIIMKKKSHLTDTEKEDV